MLAIRNLTLTQYEERSIMLIKQAFMKRRLGILNNSQQETTQSASDDDVPDFIKSLTHEYQDAVRQRDADMGAPQIDDTIERTRNALITTVNDLKKDDFNLAARAEAYIEQVAGDSALRYETPVFTPSAMAA